MNSIVCRAFMIVFVTLSVIAVHAEGRRDPFPPMQPPFFTLVAEGAPRAVVVTSPTPSRGDAFAAQELVAFILRMTGAELPVKTSAIPNAYPLFVGEAARAPTTDVDWSTLGDEGFLLRSDTSGAYIAGATDLGTVYAVYTLLERFGVRFFMPGEIGEVVPATTTLRLGALDETQTPSFRYRWIDRRAWALRNKMNIDVEIAGEPAGPQWKWGYHTHFYLVSPDEYFDEHPEWFALVNGERRRRKEKRQQGYQLCTSNPGAHRKDVRRMSSAFFDENPEIDILSLAPQDGGGFCECAPCRALDEDRSDDEAWHARYSNRLAVFNNNVARRVARKYPEKIIKVGAYAMYVRVPLDPDYRPEPNLAVQVCHTYSCNNHPIDSDCPRQRKYFRKELERWAEITNHLFIYEYYNKGMWGSMPYDQVHVIRHDMPYFSRIGVEAFYTQPPAKKWFACGLNHYIAAKLAWDVDLDVDRLLEDYYNQFFEDAAAPMRRYYEGLMAAFVDYGDCISPYGYKWPTFAAPEIYTPAVMAQLSTAVHDADAAATNDIARERIRPIRAQLGYLQRVLDYLEAVRAPFDGVDLNDANALEAAHHRAREIGAPLSRGIQDFCKASGVRPFPRIDAAHESLRFLVTLPGQTPLLR